MQKALIKDVNETESPNTKLFFFDNPWRSSLTHRGEWRRGWRARGWLTEFLCARKAGNCGSISHLFPVF